MEQPACNIELSSVSAVLPAHNEQKNLQGVVRDLVAALARRSGEFEVIIVDDGSEDGTSEVASNLAAADHRIRLIRHETNRGYGAALRTGFENARMEWIFFMDADGQFVPDELTKLVREADRSDFIAGERINRQDPLHRLLYGKLFSLAMRALFGVKARDVNCAFKLFKKSLLEGGSLQSTGALINTEILIAARRKGIEPVQVPVTHLPRPAGQNSGGSLSVISRAMAEVIRLMGRRHLGS